MSEENIKLLRGEPEKAINHLAWPIVLSMILTSLYMLIDGIWITGLGQTAIAGVGYVTPIFMILNGVSVGLGVGATSLISRYVGAKNRENASKSATHSIIIFTITSILLTILLLLIQKPALIMYGATGQALTEGLNYSTILFAGLFTFIFANGGTGILRGEGDMKRALYAVILSVTINTIIDPIFIYTLKLGTAGAAWASIISCAISAILIFYWILKDKKTYVQIKFKKFYYNKKITSEILKVAIPSSLEMIIIAISYAAYLYFISIISGETGIAAFSSGQRLYMFLIMPLTAIGSAVVAVSGSAYGAKNNEYLKRSHKYGSKLGAIFGLTITIIFILFSKQLSYIFAYTPQTHHLIPIISQFLIIIGLAFPFTGIGVISSSIYQGLGKGIISLIFTILREIIACLSLSYIFAFTFGLGLIGIWIGTCLGRVIMGIINYLFAKHTIKKY